MEKPLGEEKQKTGLVPGLLYAHDQLPPSQPVEGDRFVGEKTGLSGVSGRFKSGVKCGLIPPMRGAHCMTKR
jgi:hypothetical protein